MAADTNPIAEAVPAWWSESVERCLRRDVEYVLGDVGADARTLADGVVSAGSKALAALDYPTKREAR